MNDDEKFMATAEAFQKSMGRFAAMVSGAVKQFVDQGWPEEQARQMVFAALITSMNQARRDNQ